MPVIFRAGGFRFHFFSYEGSPREPAHVHVTRAGADAKFWLEPQVRMAYDRGLTGAELRRATEIIILRRDELIDAWNDFFAGTD